MPTVKNSKTKPKAKVPATRKPAAVPMPDDWKLAIALIEAGAPRVLLYGPPGTGKTYTAQHCKKSNGELSTVFVLPCTEDTPSSDVFGTDTIRGGDVIWRNGIGMMAWEVAHSRLVLDELDKASPEMLTSLLKVCDEQDSAGFHLPSGVFVQPREGLQVIACMNGEPEDLPEALADRFTVRVRITNPHPEAIMALSDDLWDAARETTHAKIPEARRYTIRQFRAFDELRKLGLKETDAATAAFEGRGKDLLATLRIKRKALTITEEEVTELTSVLASFGAMAEVASNAEAARILQRQEGIAMAARVGVDVSGSAASKSGRYHAIDKYGVGLSSHPVAFMDVEFSVDGLDDEGQESFHTGHTVTEPDGSKRWRYNDYNTAIERLELVDLMTGKLKTAESVMTPMPKVSSLSDIELDDVLDELNEMPPIGTVEVVSGSDLFRGIREED